MTQDARDEDRLKAERRAFLEKCGRFAAVTPPVVTLMLAVSDKAKAQLATSPRANGTTTTTVTTLQQINMPLDGPSDRKKDLATMIDSMGVKKII
jgi:hypothetical protein